MSHGRSFDEERVLDDLSSPCCFVEGAVGDQQIIDITQCAHTVTVERCYYDRHDACPNSGRARPPERQGRMGELYHLMVKVPEVERVETMTPMVRGLVSWRQSNLLTGAR